MQRTPCDFCGYLSGKHDWACPKSDSMSEDAKVQARKDWDKGYHAGWTSGVNPADASRSYKLGYGHGATELRGMQDDGELFSVYEVYPKRRTATPTIAITIPMIQNRMVI